MSKSQQINNMSPRDWPKTADALQNPEGEEEDRLLAAEVAEDRHESGELRCRAVISFGVALEYI